MDNVIDFSSAGEFNIDPDYLSGIELGDISINTHGDDTITFT